MFLQNWYLFDYAYHIKRQQIYYITQIFLVWNRHFNKELRGKTSFMGSQTPLSEMMGSRKCFLHVSKTPTLTHNRANIVIIKNTIILNIIYNVFNLRDTEVVIMYNTGSIKKNGWPQSSYIFDFHFYCIICKSICIFLKQKSLYLFRARKTQYLTIY